MTELHESPVRHDGTTSVSGDTESTFVRTPSVSASYNVSSPQLDQLEPVSGVTSPSSTVQSQAPLQPKQPDYNIRTARLFFAALCVLWLFQFAFVSGYTPSILSALEIRYGLSSTQVAIVISAYDIGGFFTAIPISYIGGSSVAHRPVWIGVAGLLMALASLIWALPDFFGGLYTPDDTLLGSVINGSNTTIETSSFCMADAISHNSSCNSNSTSSKSEDNSGVALGVFIIGHTLSGISAMTPASLGPPYMQDGFPPASFASYLGFLYATTALGPVLGFGLGAACQSIYVDFAKSANDFHLTTTSPAWVGAWWLGYVMLSGGLALASIPFFFFPRSLANHKAPSPSQSSSSCATGANSETGSVAKKNDANEDEADNDMVLPTLNEAPRELLRDAWSLLKNPVWILNNAIFIAVSSPVNGFVAYLKKYIESMFGYPAPTASLLMGGILVPAAAFGVAGGGLVNRKFGANFTAISARHLLYAGVAGGALIIMMLVRCPNNAVVGVHLPYFTKPDRDVDLFSDMKSDSREKLTSPALASDCNRECACSPSHYDPICGSDGYTYFSGCHAGCSTPPQLSKTNDFSECKCVANWSDTARENLFPDVRKHNSTILNNFLKSGYFGTAGIGACTACLTSSIVFLAVTFVSTLSMSFGHNGAMLMLLRSIPRSKRPLSLGLHLVLFKLLAAVPAPLLFGWAVDSACIYSSSATCSHSSSDSLLGSYCILYDADRLATHVFGLAFGYCGVAAVFLVVLFSYLMRNRWKEFAKKYLTGSRAVCYRSSQKNNEKDSSANRFDNDVGSNFDALTEIPAVP